MGYVIGFIILILGLILGFVGGALFSTNLLKRKLEVIYNVGFHDGWEQGREDLLSYIDKTLGVEIHMDSTTIDGDK